MRKSKGVSFDHDLARAGMWLIERAQDELNAKVSDEHFYSSTSIGIHGKFSCYFANICLKLLHDYMVEGMKTINQIQVQTSFRPL